MSADFNGASIKREISIRYYGGGTFLANSRAVLVSVTSQESINMDYKDRRMHIKK